VDKKDRWF